METKEEKVCRACGSTNCIKRGKRKGKQCWLCKCCGFQFTREDDRKDPKNVLKAVALYCAGLSYRAIGALMNYHNTTILHWVNDFAKEHYSKPVPKGEILVELDEMHHYLQSKKTLFGYGKHIVERLNDLSTGKLEIEVRQPLNGCITV